MARNHFLLSPFGEVHLEHRMNHTRIEAETLFAGDWALGWWHARQAGDEAVFSRSVWRGRLGTKNRSSPARTELDAFVSHWSFDADLDLETNRLSQEHRARVQAYTQGFNQARRRSQESSWTQEDCHLLVRTLGFLEWWETRAPQIAFLLEAVQAGLSWPKILGLWPDLGSEPERSLWKGLTLPPRFSPEAQGLLNHLRRFRTGATWIVPGLRTSTGRPLLAASYVTDVTDPGLPFLPVQIDTPEGSIRGLSRPGHPGFLAGKTRWLAWHATPAVDDSVDLQILDRHETLGLAGVWAGSGRTGTLQGLLTLEEVPTAELARDRTQELGSACLDFSAVDSLGGTARWAQGPRWLRPPRDAWLPAPRGSDVPVGPRHHPPESHGIPGRMTTERMESLLARTQSHLVEEVLPSLRFLLPDSELGEKLRRWTGIPEKGPESKAFERLYEAVLDVFWEGSPVVPEKKSPVFQALLPAIDRLIQAPHSAWFPSADKNLRLADAVRRAFAPGQPEGFPTLGRSANKPCWVEEHGGHSRIFASTVALVIDPGLPDWKVFLTDDETAAVDFRSW
jgi:hypothetical protein